MKTICIDLSSKMFFIKIYIYHFLINIFIKIGSQSYVSKTVSLSKTTLFFFSTDGLHVLEEKIRYDALTRIRPWHRVSRVGYAGGVRYFLFSRILDTSPDTYRPCRYGPAQQDSPPSIPDARALSPHSRTAAPRAASPLADRRPPATSIRPRSPATSIRPSSPSASDEFPPLPRGSRLQRVPVLDLPFFFSSWPLRRVPGPCDEFLELILFPVLDLLFFFSSWQLVA